jgi:hypothetical protein
MADETELPAKGSKNAAQNPFVFLPREFGQCKFKISVTDRAQAFEKSKRDFRKRLADFY